MLVLADIFYELLMKLPRSAIILLVGNPYTYTFHVGVEILKKAFMNYHWYIVVNDIPQRYADVIARYNVFKNDITFINDLSKGVEVLKELLSSNGNLIYVLINDAISYISDYYSVLVRRDQKVDSIVVIQVDEEIYKSLAYIADLIIRLGVIEDSNTLKTVAMLAKIVLAREAVEIAMNYRVLQSGVLFEEFVRI